VSTFSRCEAPSLHCHEIEYRIIAARKDEDIDFSDIPPVLDWSKAEMGKFYRPAKNSVTTRLDSDIIA
jgi:hypothetical protein